MNTWIVWLLQFVLPRRFWYRRFYLRSAHWKATRAKKLKQVGYGCERCKKQTLRARTFLDVHHKTYKNIFHERMSDLEVLCRFHHKLEHASHK